MLRTACLAIAMASIASVAAADTDSMRLTDGELDRVSAAGLDDLFERLTPSFAIGGDNKGNFGVFNSGNGNTGIGNAGTRNFGIGNRGNRNVGLFLSGGSNFGVNLAPLLPSENGNVENVILPQ